MGLLTDTPQRREFQLPEEDEEFLDASGLPWEAAVVMEGASRALWIFVTDYPLPVGYSQSETSLQVKTVTLGIRVTGYPSTGLDMVYVHPPLCRSSGQQIAAVGNLTLDGRTFQQWSRHYSSTNQFRIGTDNIGTHLSLIDEWFRKEVRK